MFATDLVLVSGAPRHSKRCRVAEVPVEGTVPINVDTRQDHRVPLPRTRTEHVSLPRTRTERVPLPRTRTGTAS